MKTRILPLVGALILILAAPGLSAQDYVGTPVKVSQEKVLLSGKVYLSHAVLERQTLYGIAKAYGVTVEDLYEANPTLRDTGLQKNTIILIPTETTQASPAEEKTKPEPQAPGFVEHTVMWYEDLESIAADYGVTPQEIMDANHLRGRKVNTRQVIRIPLKGSSQAPAQETAVAAREETVTPPEIPTLSDPVIADPELADAGTFKPITVNKVEVEKATTKEKEEVVLPPEVPVIADPVIADPEMAESGEFKPVEIDPLKVDPAKALEGEKTETEEKEGPLDDLFDWFAGKGTVEMALILPFNASGSYTESNMDFYSGVLMAIRDLEAEGVKASLNVYDLQAGLPSAQDLEKNDFVLGPVSTKDLTSVLESVSGRVPVVSPLDQRAATLSDTYSGFIQAPAGTSSQYTDLAAWAVAEAGRGDKIILVTEKSSSSNPAATGVRNALLDAGADFEGVSYTQAEGRSLPSGLVARLTKGGGVNRIIVASEKEAFIADAVRNLGILRGRGYDIVMYAPSRVRTFDTVDGSAYHQNRLHITSGYFVNYSDPRVQSFIRTYRALYRTEPSQFAFQGYDIARYFSRMCAKYGKRWTNALPREAENGLHTDFHFEETSRGSFRNTAVRRIVYNQDYTTELVR